MGMEILVHTVILKSCVTFLDLIPKVGGNKGNAEPFYSHH